MGVFYKHFDKPIEYYFNRTGPGTNTFNILNTDEARAFGGELDAVLASLDPPAGHDQRQRARTLVQDYRREWLREQWPTWYDVPDERERVEFALGLIAAFQDGPQTLGQIPALLDQLADHFFNTLGERNALTLARYLFQVRGLKGAEPDYWLPQNSNLRAVIEGGRGIPISLALVYGLVGRRLGYAVTACNWPNHFLATALHNGERIVIDCFRGGHCVEADKFLNLQGPSREAARLQLEEDASPETIMARVLKNLVRQYQYIEHFPNAQLMVDLLKDLERRQSSPAKR